MAYRNFDDFLQCLSQDKRKKIRQSAAGSAMPGALSLGAGTDIEPADWDFFYRCYERTYLEHGNPPPHAGFLCAHGTAHARSLAAVYCRA